MFSRRKFLRHSTLGSFTFVLSNSIAGSFGTKKITQNDIELPAPLVLATWKNRAAVANAWELIAKGNAAVDAVEEGVRVVEADPKDMSVGYGGRPDREGRVSLDACIMDSSGNAGSVCFLQHIKHPVSVARRVMEDSPHLMLAGEGALQFALSSGFTKENLLTELARKQWEEWQKESKYEPIINIENHDTIGMLAIDQQGNLAGACTTSGLAYKMHGRVGDSPIIGAGLYIDNEIGGAAATGMGEAVIKLVGSFLIVELMRQGKSPQEACKEAVMRIVRKQNIGNIQVGFIAINKQGQTGAFSIHSGFNYTLQQEGSFRINESKYHLRKRKQ